ncbi:MAG: carbohydrate binding domain-containing protein [Verrucomicrobia bacterium]|nr:carbohydrate binding domain-containing protein [Verrucomicrobiota bacterium]
MKVATIVMGVSLLFPFNAMLLITVSAEGESENLIANGSFEDGKASWGEYAEHGFGVIDQTTATDGKCSLKMDGSAALDLFRGAGQNLTVKLEPSTEYLLKADIKRSAEGGKGSYVGVDVLEKANKEDDWSPPHRFARKPEKGINVWEHFEARFKTNDQIAAATLELYNVNTGGMVWFDNIQLIKVEKRASNAKSTP